jgi:hypothetical protein
VALTIATWADVGSGVIPERFQPSISTIAEATGMGATTVKKHLTVLESGGWLLRDRPEIARARAEHARTRYALMVPSDPRGHGPETTMPRSGDDHAMGQSGPRHGPEPTEAWSGAGHKSSLNPDESPTSTSSSPAEPVETEPPATPDVTDGGGGGVSPSRQIAEEITAVLDYRGTIPDKRQRQTIVGRLAAAIDAGWTIGGLAVYLDLGDAPVQSPAAVYAHRLHPDRLPDPETPTAPAAAAGGIRGPALTAADYEGLTLQDVLGERQPVPDDGSVAAQWQQASQRAAARLAGVGGRSGTDGRMDGWDDIKHQLIGYQPYSNDPWRTPADPAEAAKIPWCKHWDCDEKTRLRDGQVCPECHPAIRWPQ